MQNQAFLIPILAGMVALATGTAAQSLPDWSTYHGDPALRGYSPAKLPDEPVQLWRFNAGSGIPDTPVGGPDHIYFTTRAGKIFCVDTAGREVWSRTIPDPSNPPNGVLTFDAPALLISNLLVLASSDGTVHALDPANGTGRWTAPTGEHVQGTPNIATFDPDRPAIIILTQSSGILHAFEPTAGKRLWSSPPTARSDGSIAVNGETIAFGNCSAALHMWSARTGQPLLSAPLGQDCQIAGGVAADGDFLFAGSRCGQVTCVTSSDGAIVWTNRVATGEVFTTPAVDAESVVFGAGDSHVYCLHRATGVLKWKVQANGPISSPVIAGDKVVVSAGGSVLIMALKDGKELWTRKIGDDIAAPAIIGGMILVGSDDGYLTALGKK